MVNNKSSEASDDLLEAMHELLHLARARHRQPGGDGDHSLGAMEGRALGYFLRHPGHTQSDLVLHTGRDKGQLARLIGGLKERGLLAAQVDAVDRRIVRLHPTDAAQRLHQDIQRQRRQVSALAAAGLSAQERLMLLQLLRRMQENLRGGAPVA